MAATSTTQLQVASSENLSMQVPPPPASLLDWSTKEAQIPPALSPLPSLGTAELHQQFTNKLAGIVDPAEVLRLASRLQEIDSPDLLHCIRSAYPGLNQVRENTLDSIRNVCDFFHIPYEEPDDRFWTVSARRCILHCQDLLKQPYSAIDDAEEYRNTRTDCERFSAMLGDLEASFRNITAAFRSTQLKLPLFTRVTEDMELLVTRLKKVQSKVETALVIAERLLRLSTSAESTSSTASFIGVTIEKEPPSSGAQRVNSSASGIEPNPSPSHTSRLRKSGKYTSHGQPSPTTDHQDNGPHRSHTRSIGLTNRSLWPLKLPRLPSMQAINDFLGDPVTVWTLIIIAAIASAATTAIAIWEAGPNALIPLIDGNFYSNLSQNLIGAAGLYCIIIPILRKAGVKGTDSLRFRTCLTISGAGALLSVGVYPVHLRTSMILAFLSGLAQLLATLQVLEDAATTVTDVNESNRYLTVEGDQLKMDGERLAARVEDLEGQLARRNAGDQQ